MSRSTNTLKTSDVTSTPIKIKYRSSFESASFDSNGIQVLKGINDPVSITGSVPETTLNYLSVKHLYYSNYVSGSFPVSASYADNFLQSTAASASGDSDNRYFPTQSGAEITILSIPRQVYGEQISRTSFILSSSLYIIADDGNGNLLEVNTALAPYLLSGYFDLDEYFTSGSDLFGSHVGNIFYTQGIAVITNPSYQSYFP